MNIKISFPDGSEREFPKDISSYDVAMSISPGLARNVVAAKVNDKLIDLNAPIKEDASIELYKFDSEIGQEIYWHSTAHLMAQAVQEIYPDVKVTIGPAIENGFYYDFDKEIPFTDADLVKIEAKMKELSKQKLEYKREEISREDAIKKFADMGETYKVELLEEIPEGEVISLYSQGNFVDLCRGPHLPNTGMIKSIKLLKTSGAYWRGDEKNKMLQRIYGISFPSNKELNKYLAMLEEAKKRDHRKLGKELDIYSISDDIGAGLVLWHPRGAILKRTIENYILDQYLENGYQLVNTPHIAKIDLWNTSGHTGFYRENMFPPMHLSEISQEEKEDYQLKPMNCPYHMMIYKSHIRSYRELPIRYAELGTVYRYERSGVLHGMLRVRGFTQDDAHIFCTPEQLEDEIFGVIELADLILKKYGFEKYKIDLSVRDENKDKYAGDDQSWEKAEQSLINALNRKGWDYHRAEGEAVFYGPKIDIKLVDALGREWQATTVQFDFNLPTRFGLYYVGDDNQHHTPFVVHRAIFGSLERFVGTIIEHHTGAFPLWLSPVQIKILTITERENEYAEEVYQKLEKAGFRIELDLRNEKLGYKIREGTIQKIPYLLIIGKKEAEEGKVAVRKYHEGDLGAMALEEFVDKLKSELQ